MKFFSNLMQRSWQLLAAMAISVSLAACGGGGGGGAGEPILGGGTAPGGGGGSTTPAVTVAVTLSSSTVTAASPATVTALVKNRAGVPLKGLVVSFSTTAGLGGFSAASALTDDNGLATVQLQPKVATATGADTLVASVTVDGTAYTGSTGFQLTATNVTIASFSSDVSTLGAYGQTSLTLVLNGTTSGNPVNAVVTSTCVVNGKASLTPTSTTTTTGRAVFTYRDNGCGAVATSDPVQVSVTGTTLTSSLNIGLTSPAVSSIAFISSSPDTIFLKGSGYVENSNVKFRVNDASGNGLPGQSVSLELNTLAGGVTLEGGTVPVTRVTDSNGEVIVRVNAGTVPTPVRVKATLVGSSIGTVSSSLAIAVGLPSQLNFSLSQGSINIEGYDYDGTANTYTVIASDRLGNPVPAGTAINFVTEGGQIQSSQLTTVAGGLSRSTANYASAQPKPVDGRITVVAYALGEESFLDTNGNNVYDSTEDYQDLGDIFIDRNYNFGGKDKAVVYDGTVRFDPSVGFNEAVDQFVGLSLGGAAACRIPTSYLLDLRVDIPVKPGSCVTGWGQAYVRRAVETILSRSTAFFNWGTAPSPNLRASSAAGCPASIAYIDFYDKDGNPQKSNYFPLASGATYYGSKASAISMRLADTNPIAYNPMPAGTVITASGTTGLSATVSGGSPVPSTSVPNAITVNYSFADDAFSGVITMTARSPNGVSSSATLAVSRESVPAGYVSCP